MTQARKVAILVGSLRKGSNNRKMANALIKMGIPGLDLTILEIGDLPLYNEDLDTDARPDTWTSFREALRSSAAVLFITPEYNRSVPGALKNAIDVGSRPYGKSAWQRKPGAVISLSPGKMGAFGANHHLRQSLVFLNVPAMAQPEAYIGGAAKLFDDAGNLVDDGTRTFLQEFMKAFAAWIDMLISGEAVGSGLK